MRSLSSVIGLAITLFTLSNAAAAEDEATAKARIHLRAGIADYDEGRYAEAANEMEQAYAMRPLADLQYNLAQCYERLNRLEDAAKAYETYLSGRHDAPDTETVRKRIENLRERMKAHAEGHEAPAPTKGEEKVVFKTIVVYREVPPPPGRAARWAAYAVGALGLIGLGTGIAFAVLTAKASNDVHDQGSLMNPLVFDGSLRATQDAAHLYPIGTGVGFGIGGLGIGGAIGLYVASRKIDREALKSREREQSLLERVPSLAPFYARSGAATIGGVTIAGRF
jgi:tetratricopeptide (TPR) repeat protein